jgi:hypothetical protein
MRLMLAVLGVLMLVAPLAHAKKFQYSSGPKPAADTAFSVAETELEPVTSARGPKVAPTNLNLVGMVADAALRAPWRARRSIRACTCCSRRPRVIR